MKIKKTGIVKNPLTKEDMLFYVKESMDILALDWENNVKEIISEHSVDTGEFLNSIWSEVIIKGDKVTFKGHDGVKYGIFWEKGTKAHWVPFYRNGNVGDPILADWGHRVLGLTQEEMLQRGGMTVKIPKLEMFMKSLLLAQDRAPPIFKKSRKDKMVKRIK